MTNDIIAQLAEEADLCFIDPDNCLTSHFDSYSDISEEVRRFAKLIIKRCADAADQAHAADCNYPGDYIVEHLGLGTDVGAATWRSTD